MSMEEVVFEDESVVIVRVEDGVQIEHEGDGYE